MNISRLDFFAGCALAGYRTHNTSNNADLTAALCEKDAKALDEKLPRQKTAEHKADDSFVFTVPESVIFERTIKELRSAMREIEAIADANFSSPACARIHKIAGRFCNDK